MTRTAGALNATFSFYSYIAAAYALAYDSRTLFLYLYGFFSSRWHNLFYNTWRLSKKTYFESEIQEPKKKKRSCVVSSKGLKAYQTSFTRKEVQKMWTSSYIT